ncbi:MAG: hypothetical protein ACE3JK_08895 [Sporolactobacillus sp.]
MVKNGMTGDIIKKGNKNIGDVKESSSDPVQEIHQRAKVEDVKEEAVGKNVSVGRTGKEAKKAEEIEEIREKDTVKSGKVSKEGHLDLPTRHDVNSANKKVGGANNVNPSEIRFSQTSVNGSEEIITSMKANGWKGEPIDVVRMPDGSLTTVDNTRVAAAREAGIDVKATVRNYDGLLPANMVDRFTTKKRVPKT